MPLEDVCKLTGFTEQQIGEGIDQQISSYPERDFDAKYAHFILFNRAFRWLFEGEDRNRHYFWHLAPFYSLPFLNYALNCPDSQKSRYALYKRFLSRLAPEVCTIDNANWGFPPLSRRYYLMEVKNYLRGRIPSRVKKRIKRLCEHKLPESYKSCVRKQLESCETIREYIRYGPVTEKIDRSTKKEAQMLLTVTSALEQLACGRSSLVEYAQMEF
jgi:asparagine synthase (glutamine-hydrolysing)